MPCRTIVGRIRILIVRRCGYCGNLVPCSHQLNAVTHHHQMKTHFSKTMSKCFAALHQICSIRGTHSTAGCEFAGGDAVSVLSASHMPYLPVFLIDRLQSTLNVTARLIYMSWKYDHVTPLLRELYCLKAIEYKLAVLACHCSNGPKSVVPVQ